MGVDHDDRVDGKSGHLGEEVLDRCRRDVLTGPDDHVLESVDDEQLTLVEEAQVPGTEPLRIEGIDTAIGSEIPRGQRGRSGHDFTADVVSIEAFTVLVDDEDLGAEAGRPHSHELDFVVADRKRDIEGG